jgi:hypothetical protein
MAWLLVGGELTPLRRYHAGDRMKLARSRVIGNDITTIVYQEGLTPYHPDTIPGDVHRTSAMITRLPVFFAAPAR